MLWTLLACAAPSPLAAIVSDNAVDLQHGQLAIADRDVDTAMLRALLDTSEVPGLARMRAAGNRLDGDAGSVLASHPKTRALVALDVNANPRFGPVGTRALANAPMLTTLQELRLASTGTDGEAIAALAPAPALLLLEASYNPIDDAAVDRILALPTLQRLYLRESRLSGAGARALLGHGSLVLLDLEGTKLGAGSLTGAVVAPSLKSLCLARTGLGPEDAHALATAPLSLDGLDLSGNPLGDEGVDALAGAPWLRALRALDLDGVVASEEARARLRAAWTDRPGLTL